MQHVSKSDTTEDAILLILIKKSHRCIFKLQTVDSSTGHLNLIYTTSTFLKNEDIKWVEFELDFDPVIPPNTIYYINRYNNNFVCHVEDFVGFYTANIQKIVKPDHIHVNLPKATDGWVKVTCYKKEKNDKYDQIVQEFAKNIM